ncbi:serine/threonine protein phosphatase [Synechococcus sp. PCC 7502]|uniref:PP2C family protein-serine/threonine phosphatase n=1 Tax=Synechococcus sp. PCC 7502 TaxID=1173263 RepID=UPI00029FE3DB|nr:protein phosphatase 2C domain-containing protein [Synechococcus sp. PCC 7502]AFY73779.1 serine/threonine protein phosphatase [Synechococcus sp. PCC 7502]
MKLVFAGNTDVGCVRSANQDSFWIDPEGRFFVVADGMGGHAGGEEASRIAVDVIKTYLETKWDEDLAPQELLQSAINLANDAILKDQDSHPVRRDMGTTVVVLVFRDNEPWYCHIGDSRLYRLRGAKLEQISADHTWIAKAIETGTVDAEEARSHPWRHMLIQCLGREDIDRIKAAKVDFQPGDRFLICSDGLTEELSNERIANQLKTIRSCEQATTALINAAKTKGGRDNITVVIVANDLQNQEAIDEAEVSVE